MWRLQACAIYVSLCSATEAVLTSTVCQNPRASIANNYATQEATLFTAHVYTVKFSLICSDGQGYPYPVFFRVNDSPEIGAAAVVDANNNLQISWKTATYSMPNKFSVALYDEASFNSLRKFPDSPVKHLTDLFVEHTGPLFEPWIPSEVVAIGVAFVLMCHAITSRARIV